MGHVVSLGAYTCPLCRTVLDTRVYIPYKVETISRQMGQGPTCVVCSLYQFSSRRAPAFRKALDKRRFQPKYERIYVSHFWDDGGLVRDIDGVFLDERYVGVLHVITTSVIFYIKREGEGEGEKR